VTQNGTGAPRLAETRPEQDKLASLWNQLVEAMTTLASVGLAHGDLSPTTCSSITSGW
jgi:RIO kinase 1